MITNTIAEDIKSNWDEIKSKIKKHWKKISSEDLDEIEGSYTRLIEKVEHIYDITKEEATEKVNAYIEKLGYTDQNNTLLDQAQIAKSSFEKCIVNSIEKIKDTSENIHEDIHEYVKNNPLKSMGLAVLAGVVTGKILKMIK